MTDPAAEDDDEPVKAATVPLTPATGKQRVLLVIVITLGVLILLAFGVLVGGMVIGKSSGSGTQSGTAPWTYSLQLPERGRIVSTRLEGDRIVVRVRAPEGETVFLLDAKTGKAIGRIEIKQAQ